MNKCLNCDKELIQTDGKRDKKFCSNTCRSSYWFKQNKVPKVKTVPIEEWNELQNKLKKLEGLKDISITDLNKPTDQIKDITKEPPETNYTIDTKPKEEEGKNIPDEDRKVIEFKIKEWQSKKYPSYMSKSAFEKMRDKEIEELKSKL